MKNQTSGDQLTDLLTRCFPEDDARLLQYFFRRHADAECFAYKDLRLPEDDIHDLLMLGFEQRMILPEKTRMGPAWEDRILTFDEAAIFQVPPIVRQIAQIADSQKNIQMDHLMASIFVDLSSSDINNMSQLLTTIMNNSRNRIFEAGLLDLYHKQINTQINLHDMLDLFVISGIMSPCPVRSINTGLAWYEINPVCYWLKPSMQ
jgi:hypothetical protein